MAVSTRTLARGTTLRAFAPGADWSGFTTAVSLHAHTHHSREVMSDLPAYISRIPILAGWFEREGAAAIDFSRGCWRPPVSPRQVFDSEAGQIDRRFSLQSIISVTDHDDITAGVELQQHYAARRAPISFEWTVPYGSGFFHLGVHNLHPAIAATWFNRLAALTANPQAERLADVFEDLNTERDILIVFNHPLWDLAGVGAAMHTTLMREFLDEHRSRLHAIEINGYRSRAENGGARKVSADLNMPLVSGGDRHTLAPNALVNLTRASSFAEFAEEIRAGHSHVVVMPEYRRHIGERVLASVGDVLRTYRAYPKDRRRWIDRVSWEGAAGMCPLSTRWPDGGPLWVRSSIGVCRFITSPIVRPVVGTMLEQFDPSSAVGPVPLPR